MFGYLKLVVDSARQDIYFDCYYEDGSMPADKDSLLLSYCVSTMITDFRYYIGKLICIARGHHSLICDSWYDEETGHESFECTCCGRGWSNTYY